MATTPTIEMFEVGGCVRDDLMGIPTKDVDFTVIAPSFEMMRLHLVAEGFRIWQVRPEYVTIRAGVPEDHPLRARTKDADFVLARKDGPSTDGRRPDFVEPGTLIDDLARRDFTVNAIARGVDGVLIDPHGGVKDIEAGMLRFVGEPMDRINEDGLRVLRGFRFMVTKDLKPDISTFWALASESAADMLTGVSIERVREEVERMVAHDTMATMNLFGSMFVWTQEAIFRQGLRLSATLKG